jgi:hypothetical protein
MTDKNNYLTKDIGEATALIATGQNMIKIEKTAGICWFTFENEEKCKNLSDQYWFGQLSIEARNYKDILDRLKNRIFSI